MSDKSPVQYWYNTSTGQVEEGTERSSWTNRLGPYPTREAAERALDTAKQRNDSWEEEEADWRGHA
ncbi:SPOR domain-containing protein [Isoptericola sp. NEAU-Y5]|uniref:SPOR domain-containing protein n=1 Tax=Isoptericola luteus TaxID=2879484 RepID=A0ABS7ZIY3_9MICO|nr:SPOR domain-containing protein [Isoptericola sp. NEAU-Y5]MCA5894991.1 SPOR domain-containing protein [Isoptericola sp. NEAU-Y5]